MLSVWNKVERVLVAMPGGNNTKMQVIRLRTDDNQRIVGKIYTLYLLLICLKT